MNPTEEEVKDPWRHSHFVIGDGSVQIYGTLLFNFMIMVEDFFPNEILRVVCALSCTFFFLY